MGFNNARRFRFGSFLEEEAVRIVYPQEFLGRREEISPLSAERREKKSEDILMGKTLKHTIMKQVIVRLKGDFYSMNTYCSTLKEFLEKRNLKRSDVAEWWKE